MCITQCNRQATLNSKLMELLSTVFCVKDSSIKSIIIIVKIVPVNTGRGECRFLGRGGGGRSPGQINLLLEKFIKLVLDGRGRLVVTRVSLHH